MGNCLSTCAKRPGQEEGVQTTDVELVHPVHNQGEDSLRDVVQQELQALQNQISHSQAVLAKLHFRFSDDATVAPRPELPTVHRTTQTSNPDTLPKSLECVAVTTGPDWRQITSSCPAIVSTAVQTDDESTSKSTGTSAEYFLPPISPQDLQLSEPESPRDMDEPLSKPFEPRTLGHMDLDIYRSCRKLSVLPEEEIAPEEVSPPTAGNRLAPCLQPYQAHSFESYLLPVPSCASVRRQLSDPTPSPEIHPVSRRSSRSTCRPLQLQGNYFRFPDVRPPSPEKEVDQPPKSPPCVTFQSPLEVSDDDYLPRITSPTYSILQDTVSQLITMSSETLGPPKESLNPGKKESLTIPSYYAYSPDGSSPFKTPPENSSMSTPGFFTPQDMSEKKILDSSSSSSFQTPTSVSPSANGIVGDSNKSSNSSQSFKTPPVEGVSDRTSYQSSFSSPLYLSPLPCKRPQPPNKNNEETFTEVPDLTNVRTNGKLYVKPLPGEFDRSRTMLSILLDEPRVQADNTDETSFISFTSLPIQHPPPLHSLSSDQVPSTSLSSPDATLSLAAEGLARTPSRRKLQRSMVRINSETTLDVPLDKSVPSPSAAADVCTAPATREPEPADNGTIEASTDNMAAPDVVKPEVQDVPKMRRTNSDCGSGPMGNVGCLTASHSFPSLSDTVLRQLGALMEEVKQKEAIQKEENQSTEKDIEGKFTSLMLAFRTDKLTLERRLELQQRLRDQAEANMASELNKLKAAVQLLSPLCTDSEKIELLEKVGEQVDALHKSTTRVSTSAEMYGAVQQENRLSKAVDIVLRHVENLKQAYDKEKTEHEETRKVLTENKTPPTAVLKLESRSVSRARLGSLPRKLSNTILETDAEDPSSSTNSSKDPAVSGGGHMREVVESVSNGTQAPARTLPRRLSRPAILEVRRVSHTGETESEDESLPLEPVQELQSQPPAEQGIIPNIQRRPSQQAAWLCKAVEQFEWVQPMDQMLMHLRCFLAVVLLIAALAVFTSTFILPHTYLGS